MPEQNVIAKGRYRDQLIKGDGTAVDFDWRSNLIVDRCRHLLTAFVRGDGASGVQLLAFGRGEAVWDTIPPPPAGPAMQQLVDPAPFTLAAGAAEVSMDYLDVAGAVTTDVSNRLQITATLAPGTLPIGAGDTTFPLREFALFGRFGTEDYMINYIRHPVIAIAADDSFARTIRLVF